MELLYRDEVYRIVGAAIEVHRALGSGFLEPVYQEAMEIELGIQAIPYAAQVELPIYYKSRLLKKFYCADIVCYGKIIVELKALARTTGQEEAQILNYLKATGLRVGLLINFGDPGRLDWQRFIH